MLTLPAALLALTSCVHAVSQIALFTDSNCQDSFKGLEGPNGYPNGSCTDIRRSGDYGSLQVVGLDPGCAVTIYVNDNDTTICGGYQEEIQLGQCWNSTFVYYSIDMCDLAGLPSPSTSSVAAPPASATPSTGPTTGTLVGAILGGLAGLALLLGFALWLLAKKKRARKAGVAEEHGGYAEADAVPHRTEMDAAYHRHEMDQGKLVYKHHAVEVAQPPLELAGRELGGHELGQRSGGATSSR